MVNLPGCYPQPFHSCDHSVLLPNHSPLRSAPPPAQLHPTPSLLIHPLRWHSAIVLALRPLLWHTLPSPTARITPGQNLSHGSLTSTPSLGSLHVFPSLRLSCLSTVPSTPPLRRLWQTHPVVIRGSPTPLITTPSTHRSLPVPSRSLSVPRNGFWPRFWPYDRYCGTPHCL